MGVIKCPSCSADVDDKMLFCPNCFGELKDAKDSSQDKKTSVSNQVVNENSEEKSTENGNFIVCPSCGKNHLRGCYFVHFVLMNLLLLRKKILQTILMKTSIQLF